MTKPKKIKLACCLTWALFLTGAIFCKTFAPFGRAAAAAAAAEKPNKKPAAALIEKFDAALQLRFLNEPGFGIARITPPNPHLTYFVAKEGDEKRSVESLEADGWRAGLYLFGRRIEKRTNEENGKARFYVSNRAFAPMPVTKDVLPKNLTAPANLLVQTANAFQAFQTADTYEFDDGRWAYVAKPVRARQSCLQCHTDYVQISKIGEKPYKYRKRQVGDAIGVVIYGFAEGK